jgi:tRNA A-37 threonylcarbamoyl transferase component Bud32
MTVGPPLELALCRGTDCPAGHLIWVAPFWKNHDFLRLLVSDPDELAQRPDCEVLPTVPNTTVLRMPCLDNTLYFKYFKAETGWGRIRAMWRGSRAYRAWQGARLLLEHGLSTPEVVAVAEGKGPGRGNFSLLVTLEIFGIPLRTYLRERQLAPGRQARLASALGQEIARLHGCCITHGDLHPGNVLVEEKGEQGFSFAYLDTERVSKPRTKLNRHIIKDLSLLNHPNLGTISQRARLRFLKAYVQANSGLSDTARMLLRDIDQASAKRYGRKTESLRGPAVKVNGS